MKQKHTYIHYFKGLKKPKPLDKENNRRIAIPDNRWCIERQIAYGRKWAENYLPQAIYLRIGCLGENEVIPQYLTDYIKIR